CTDVQDPVHRQRRSRAIPKGLSFKYAPQLSRTTMRGVIKIVRAGRVGSEENGLGYGSLRHEANFVRYRILHAFGCGQGALCGCNCLEGS
ncbi:MAG TPA: hypothetical protein VFG14_03155, partial [Chthoniobacteraceae bacterium]|nr:hypothetical protein [Chthoniobacteraceae bacterium]